MENLRKYGAAPYTIAVIHGGPGAPGEMAPVARELAKDWGVLEPLQTASSLSGQVEELKEVLEKNSHSPIILIGHSWGAFLSFILTAKYPKLVKKLILISSGSFEEKYTTKLMPTRLSRLTKKERAETEKILAALEKTKIDDHTFSRFGQLMAKADAYDVLTVKNETLVCDASLFQSVWNKAAAMRKKGELLALAKEIHCPVIGIHGDYDPSPAEGVERPLSQNLDNFKFFLLKNCGHTPWIERQAKEKFYEILKGEIL